MSQEEKITNNENGNVEEPTVTPDNTTPEKESVDFQKEHEESTSAPDYSFNYDQSDNAHTNRKSKKKTQVPLRVFLLSIIAAVALCFSLTYTVLEATFNKKLDDYTSGGVTAKSELDKYLDFVGMIVDTQSYFGTTDEAVLQSVLDAYAQSTGDKYADYYTQEEVDRMMAENQGEMVGIGVNVIYNVDLKMIEIVNVLPDSPALEADVRVGDFVAYIGTGEDRVYVPDLVYEDAVDRMIGEAGTFAEFTVLRGENNSESVDFRIERRKIITQSVNYHVCTTDSKVGIIKIMEFDLTTPTQFTDAMDALIKEGCEKFVLDVRNNPGGYAISVEAVLSYFLNEGDPIIYTVDAKGNEDVSKAVPIKFSAPYDSCNINKSDIGKYRDLDVVVIANEYTASAGELFTATLQQYGIAKVVGVTTYGKGSMQTTYYLENYGLKGAVKLTTHMYFPMDKESYEGIGIKPDYEIEISDELKNVNIYKYTDDKDNQLQGAIDVMYGRK
ncbi:MAG: hypothetical protein IKA82_01515 [Clostridia bacterium]|nr:hypothetical protein [Clostridia bacterium]